MNVHGLVAEPPEQDAPVMLQLENVQPEEAVAVRETNTPTDSEHPLEQSGAIEPEPEATFVVNGSVFGSAGPRIANLIAYGLAFPVSYVTPIIPSYWWG